MTNYWNRSPNIGVVLGYISEGSRTADALDSAFTLGSAGKCVGFKFISPVTDTIDDILFFLTAAPVSAHDLSVNVCSQTSAVRAGSAVANGTITVSGGTTANVWVKATFTSKPSLTVGEAYWIVIGDPSGAASNYSLLRGGTVYTGNETLSFRCWSSSDGFATDGTARGVPVTLAIKFTNGVHFGAVYTSAGVSDSSADKERGWKITPSSNMIVSGIISQGFDSGGSIKVYEDGQNPGGTIYSGFNGGSAFAISAGAYANSMLRFPPCTLVGGTTYRIVQDPNGVAVSPGYVTIENDTTHSAILEACGFPGSFSMRHTEEAAGPTWTDSGDKIPRWALIVQDCPATSAPDYPSEDDVRDGTDYASATMTGNMTLPTVTDVKDGVTYGTNGTELEGSYAPVGGSGRPEIRGGNL